MQRPVVEDGEVYKAISSHGCYDINQLWVWFSYQTGFEFIAGNLLVECFRPPTKFAIAQLKLYKLYIALLQSNSFSPTYILNAYFTLYGCFYFMISSEDRGDFGSTWPKTAPVPVHGLPECSWSRPGTRTVCGQILVYSSKGAPSACWNGRCTGRSCWQHH